MRTCGSAPRGRSKRWVGALTVASPEMTVWPSWLTQLHARMTECLVSSRAITVTVIVSVSPTRTGARNLSVCPR
jgi:hypothetical protein